MASITSSTGASGLAIESIVSGLMSLEKQPLTQLQTRISSYNTKLSAYGTLKSGLSNFQTAVDKLSTAAKFNAQSATLTDATSMTASTDGTATAGNYSIAVSQLATSQKLASKSYAATTSVVGTGTLTISFGKYTPATTTPSAPAAFTNNSDKSSISISIDSTNNTLAGIRDAINAKNASVTASIVNDGTGNRLVINSKDSGENNSLKIDVTDADTTNTDTSGLSALAYDPLASESSGQNLTQLVAAKNALLTVDGLSVSKASNTLTDVIQGVTLNLKAVTSTSNTLTVSTDVDTIEASVKSFVDAYNTLNTSIRNLTKFVEGGSSSNGPLLGDSTTRDIAVKLKAMLSQSSSTATTYKTLSDIGIKSSGSDGSLSIDSTKLKEVLSSNLSDIAKIFAPSATTTDPQVSYLSSSDKTQSGTYSIQVSQLGSSTQDAIGMINGVDAYGSAAALIGKNGDKSQGLKLEINGSATGSRGSVTFSRGLAGELSQLVKGWLNTEGTITTKTEGIQTSIKALNKKADDINERLPSIEKRYRAQYAKLDALLSSMQNTSSYLTQQLAAISNNN